MPERSYNGTLAISRWPGRARLRGSLSRPKRLKEGIVSTTKIVALDPGVTTGYAVGIIDDGCMGVISGQATWLEFDLYHELKRSGPDIIVYERFEYRSERIYGEHATQLNNEGTLFPRNLIGVICLYVQEQERRFEHEVVVYPQMPSYALGKGKYWSDQKLKEEKVYKVANPHANDAMRHLLQWYNFGPGFKYNKKGFRPLA